VQHEGLAQILDKALNKAHAEAAVDKKDYMEMRKMLQGDVVRLIQDDTIEFIKQNLNHLPMYYIPDKP
jgi:Zn/Cd-binding protein ZinT